MAASLVNSNEESMLEAPHGKSPFGVLGDLNQRFSSSVRYNHAVGFRARLVTRHHGQSIGRGVVAVESNRISSHGRDFQSIRCPCVAVLFFQFCREVNRRHTNVKVGNVHFAEGCRNAVGFHPHFFSRKGFMALHIGRNVGNFLLQRCDRFNHFFACFARCPPFVVSFPEHFCIGGFGLWDTGVHVESNVRTKFGGVGLEKTFTSLGIEKLLERIHRGVKANHVPNRKHHNGSGNDQFFF